ncbi:MAG TPA: endonuclease/exonuclease/phosphatase family protein [Terrimicrobiaceae bacterium]|mgnify:CR=1 FL=1|nr:endonuclease/exonuclease/phosphatase family protein [Terrimicrobiaceae bacterium]
MKSLRLLFAAIILAGNATAQVAPQNPIKLVFWNAEWFPGGSPEATPAEAEAQTAILVPALASLKPDIVGLEEIRDWAASETAIKGIPGMSIQVCSDYSYESGEKSTQQVAIASKKPAIGAWWELWTAGDKVTPRRGFSFAAFQPAPGQVLLVYCVHLKSNRGSLKQNVPEREESVRQLLSHIAAMEKAYAPLGAVSIVVGGDFNTSLDDPKFSHEKTLKLLEEAGFQSCWKDVAFADRVTLPSSPSKNPKYPPFPDACFDHVYVKGAKVLSASVGVFDPAPSDHRPVVVDIALPAASR